MGLTKNLGALPKVLTVSGSSIGIGTTSPRGKLHLSSDSDMYFKISRVSGNYASQFYRNAVDGTLSWQSILSDNSTAHSYITCGEGDASHAAAKITMQTQGGNVGIGTTNPLNKFVVSNGGAQGLEIGADATYNVNLAAYNRVTSAYIPFQIDASKFGFLTGNVGIGTTNPTTNLHIKHSGAYAGIIVDNTGTTGGGGISLYRNGSQIGYVGVLGALLGSTASDLAIFSETGKNIQFFTDGTTTSKALITSGGNMLINSTSDNGYKLQVNGSITATALALAGNYNASVPTDSSWSSYQTLIPTTTLTNNVTYLISVKWTYSYPSNNQPYYYNCAFLWVGASTNSTGTDNEFTPIGSTHTGGTGASISFRTIAAFSGTSGIQARLNSFPTLGGSIQVKATRLE